MRPEAPDVLLVSESDHFLPGTDIGADPNAFSPVYEYLSRPLRHLHLPFQYTLNSPQRCSLAYLAGHLTSAGHSCELVDNVFRDEGQALRFERLLASGPAVVGISVSSLHRTESVEALAEKVRRLAPGAVLVLGGAGLHFNPSLGDRADVVVMGDGELSLGELVSAAREGGPAAPRRRRSSPDLGGGGAVLMNGRRDLSLRSLPAWRLYAQLPSSCFPIEASKGCAHSCVFCSYPERGSQAYRPVEVVAEEVRYLVRDLGAASLRFVDTNLTSDRPYAEALCRRLISEGYNVPWSCFARVDELAASPELCSLMAEAGCVWVYAGAESADPGVLASMGKGFGPDRIAEGIANAKRAGMAVHANFVVGFPGETSATLSKAGRFIETSGLDTVSFTVLGLTGGMERMAAAYPERFRALARSGPHWRHDTMDFEEARRSTSQLIRTLVLKEGAPLIASHGIGMYYLMGGGLDFRGVLGYFAAVREFHRAEAAGDPDRLTAAGRSIRGFYEATAPKFGWAAPAGRRTGGL